MKTLGVFLKSGFSKKTLALGVLAGMTALPALAWTRTDLMDVTAIVRGTCLIDSVGTMDFGTLDYGGADTIASAAVQFRCVNGINYIIYADNGGNGDRSMDDGGTNILQYELYSDAAATAVLETSNTGTNAINGAGAGMAPANAITETLYGKVLATDVDTLADVVTTDTTLTDQVTVTLEYN